MYTPLQGGDEEEIDPRDAQPDGVGVQRCEERIVEVLNGEGLADDPQTQWRVFDGEAGHR